MQYFDSQRAPEDNSIVGTYYWKSTSSTGSSTTIFDDLIIPSSPNFPNSTSIRYIMNLPGEPYYADIEAGNSTFIVKNVNSSVFLTRVAYNGTLTANTYKIFPSQSNTPARLEAHVGIGSNNAGDVLAYHGRFITSILSSTNLKSLTEPIKYLYKSTPSSTSYLETTSEIKEIKIDIGQWNMTSTGVGSLLNLSIYSTIFLNIIEITDLKVCIKSDVNTYHDFDLNLPSSWWGYNSITISSSWMTLGLLSLSSNFFNQSNFNSTVNNRGIISISYL